MHTKDAFLHVHDVSLAFNNKKVVHKVDFCLHKGDIACLIGPSGCGKTSLLNAICGFIPITTGSIALNQKILSEPSYQHPPEQRGIGMVFQDHALFPHLTVEQNIQFGLHKMPKAQKKARSEDLLNTVGLSAHRTKYPHELSGGQSQRVALARAMAPQPELLLMDEPFSNLDTGLRQSLGQEIQQLLKQHHITAIIVTHDQDDAFALGDTLGVLQDGQLLQWDTPYNIYHAPAHRFVANFIGEGVFIPGIQNGNTVQSPLGDITGETNKPIKNQKVELLLRPDDVSIHATGTINAKVERKFFKGAETLYTLITDKQIRLPCLVPSYASHAIGESVTLSIQPKNLVTFPI